MPTARRSREDAESRPAMPASHAGWEFTAATIEVTEWGMARYAEAFMSMTEALRPAWGPWVTTPLEVLTWTFGWGAGALSSYSEMLERGRVELPGLEPAEGREIDLRERATASVRTQPLRAG